MSTINNVCNYCEKKLVKYPSMCSECSNFCHKDCSDNVSYVCFKCMFKNLKTNDYNDVKELFGKSSKYLNKFKSILCNIYRKEPITKMQFCD